MNKAEKLVKSLDYPDPWRGLVASAVKKLQPKQIVELGADTGINTNGMSTNMPDDCVLYTVDIKDDWKDLLVTPKKIVKIVADDIDMMIWKGVDLYKTDVWVIDSDHSYEHVSKQWELYSPYFKKGAVIFIDDLDPNYQGVTKLWNEIGDDKYQINRLGVVVI